MRHGHSGSCGLNEGNRRRLRGLRGGILRGLRQRGGRKDYRWTGGRRSGRGRGRHVLNHRRLHGKRLNLQLGLLRLNWVMHRRHRWHRLDLHWGRERGRDVPRNSGLWWRRWRERALWESLRGTAVWIWERRTLFPLNPIGASGNVESERVVFPL